MSSHVADCTKAKAIPTERSKKAPGQLLQVAQLSQRDRAAGWVSISNGEKWKTGTERQHLQTI